MEPICRVRAYPQAVGECFLTELFMWRIFRLRRFKFLHCLNNQKGGALYDEQRPSSVAIPSLKSAALIIQPFGHSGERESC